MQEETIKLFPMKAFYLTMSIILTVVILLIAFGNIGAQCSQLKFFFSDIRWNPTVLFLFIAVIGIITGAFYHAFLARLFGTSEDEEDQIF